MEDANGSALLRVTQPGTCHAVVLWMEYDLTEPGLDPHHHQDVQLSNSSAGAERGHVVGSAPDVGGGPGPGVQGVYLLRQPLELRPGDALRVVAAFDGLDADVSIEVALAAAEAPSREGEEAGGQGGAEAMEDA